MPNFTGEVLKQAVFETPESRPYLIEGFLFEHSALMVYADDGIGKSTLVLQAMCQASCGESVFFGLKVDRPIKTIWIMAERHPLEIFERIKHMSESININFNNLSIESDLQGINLIKDDHIKKALDLIDRIQENFNPIDCIVIDPIYALVRGGMCDDTSVSSVTNFSTELQKRYDCSCIMVHHTNRGGRDQKTGERVEGDVYGSRFLSSHFSGMYHIKKSAQGTTMYLSKNSHSNLLNKIPLEFDSETYLSSLEEANMQKVDQIKNFLRSCKNSNRIITFYDIQNACEVSTQYLYKVFSRDLRGMIKPTGKLLNRKKLYAVLDV